jgi:hypothetical protein
MNNGGQRMEAVERMATFARVVEAKSFSAAARELGCRSRW